MAHGRVKAPSLNFHNAPPGSILGSLPEGATVSVLEQEGDWLRISTSVEGEICLAWVSAKWVSIGAAAGPSTAASEPVPPADDPARRV